MKSFTLPSTGVLNVSFEPASTTVATDENTLKLFPLNGFSSSDFSKTVNIVNAKTDGRQVIRNPVRYRQLEIGSTQDTSDNSALQGCKIYADDITDNNRLTHIQLQQQALTTKIFRPRNVVSSTGPYLDFIDNGGNQAILGPTYIWGSSDNFMGYSKDTGSLPTERSIKIGFKQTGDNTTANSYLEEHGKFNSIELSSLTAGVVGINTITLGNNVASQSNSFSTAGAVQSNYLNIGNASKSCTNNVSILSSTGGSNNFYLGDGTVPGNFTLSGGQTINKISTDLAADHPATALPTALSVWTIYGTPYRASVGQTVTFDGQSKAVAFLTTKMNYNVVIQLNTDISINFTTTTSGSTVMNIPLWYSTAAAVGSTAFTSYVEFGTGTFTPIIGKFTTPSVITVTILGNGFTGLNKFWIPPIAYSN